MESFPGRCGCLPRYCPTNCLSGCWERCLRRCWRRCGEALRPASFPAPAGCAPALRALVERKLLHLEQSARHFIAPIERYPPARQRPGPGFTSNRRHPRNRAPRASLFGVIGRPEGHRLRLFTLRYRAARTRAGASSARRQFISSTPPVPSPLPIPSSGCWKRRMDGYHGVSSHRASNANRRRTAGGSKPVYRGRRRGARRRCRNPK